MPAAKRSGIRWPVCQPTRAEQGLPGTKHHQLSHQPVLMNCVLVLSTGDGSQYKGRWAGSTFSIGDCRSPWESRSEPSIRRHFRTSKDQ